VLTRASLALGCLLAVGVAVQARAIFIGPGGIQQVPQKVAQADLIITGQVVAIEDQDVKATMYPNNPTTIMYRVAVVQVTETLKGKAPGNMVRVAFRSPVQPNVPPVGVPGAGVLPAPGAPAIQPAPAVQPGIKLAPQPAIQPAPAVQPGVKILPQPAIQPAIQPVFPGKGGPFIPGGGVGPALNVGQDGLFYLQKHHEGKFYILPGYNTFVSAQNNKPGVDNEVAQIRTVTKVLDNAVGALKANNANDRFEAAAMLIKMYRTGGGKAEQIPAEESQLILKALLEANWPVVGQPINYQMNPANLFNMLGINAQHGFNGPVNQGIFAPAYVQAAKGWLEKNWQTYRIEKFVAGGVPVNGPIKGQPLVPQLLPAQGGVQIQPAPGVIQIQPVQGGVIQIQVLPAQPVPAQPLPLEKK